MLKRTLLMALTIVSLSVLTPLPVAAIPIISPGTTPITVDAGPPEVFALPVEITGAESLVNWQFDLLFDPSVVQVNTACDPLSGDVYCDLFYGPVTEGPFTSSNGLFLSSLLSNGAIDNIGGQVIGIAGAYLDIPPGPSGHGVLAYVEFVTLDASGDPGFSVGNPSVQSSVPEPTTFVLFSGGLVALFGARNRMRGSERQGY